MCLWAIIYFICLSHNIIYDFFTPFLLSFSTCFFIHSLSLSRSTLLNVCVYVCSFIIIISSSITERERFFIMWLLLLTDWIAVEYFMHLTFSLASSHCYIRSYIRTFLARLLACCWCSHEFIATAIFQRYVIHILWLCCFMLMMVSYRIK